MTLSSLILPPIYDHPDTLIAGVDEVGRGALFGPVMTAAVVMRWGDIETLKNIGVKDSKQLSAKNRSTLAQQIPSLVLAYQISYATVEEIDRINILQASLLAMKRSILKLKITPHYCLVDGNKAIPNLPIPQQTIIKGDQLSPLIASASILAKVWRDQLMTRWAKKYPDYDLDSNKGYGTNKHCQAILKHGLTPQHRKSFHLKETPPNSSTP